MAKTKKSAAARVTVPNGTPTKASSEKPINVPTTSPATYEGAVTTTTNPTPLSNGEVTQKSQKKSNRRRRMGKKSPTRSPKLSTGENEGMNDSKLSNEAVVEVKHTDDIITVSDALPANSEAGQPAAVADYLEMTTQQTSACDEPVVKNEPTEPDAPSEEVLPVGTGGLTEHGASSETKSTPMSIAEDLSLVVGISMEDAAHEDIATDELLEKLESPEVDAPSELTTQNGKAAQSSVETTLHPAAALAEKVAEDFVIKEESKAKDERTEISAVSAMSVQSRNPFSHLAQSASPHRRVLKAKPQPPPQLYHAIAEESQPSEEPAEKNGLYSNLKSPAQAREKDEEDKKQSRQVRLDKAAKHQKEIKKALIDEKRKHPVSKDVVLTPSVVQAVAVIPANMSVEPIHPEHKRASSTVQEEEASKRRKQGEDEKLTERSTLATFEDEHVENVGNPDEDDYNGSSIWKMTGLLAAVAVVAVAVVIASKRKGK